MAVPVSNDTEALHQEIDRTPKEYHATLLKMIQAFREGVSLTPEEERFTRSWKQAMEGNVIPLSSLWDSTEDDE